MQEQHGIGCDFLILDDTIKNKYEAYNKEILVKIFEDWFQDTLYSRLEGKRKIIIVMTRWATRRYSRTPYANV